MGQAEFENQLLNLHRCIIDRETKFMGGDVYWIKDENGQPVGSSKKGVIRDSDNKEIAKVKKKTFALSPAYLIHDSRGNTVGVMKKKRLSLQATYTVESPGGDLIASIKAGSGGYQFHAPDGKTTLASFVWETMGKDEAAEETSKEGGLRAFGKKMATAAKAAFRGQRVLQFQSEQLRPLLALSSAIGLMEMEKEEERQRDAGGDWDDGDGD